ncbi:tetratricopeptide repeat protein [Erythrobacter sp.]|uniref:tetratricopeptide repeat protein n=1 Tax=Erythrobacter sp. TaxID=1042 RepID=UPI002EACF0DA|nr:tetratricopeptide repeat protein [Erythrobacter sp.]
MALIPNRTDKSKTSGDPGGPAPSAEDEVLIREIDEAVRQDDAAAFMKKYGPTLAGVIVLFLAAFGGWLYWQNLEESKLEAQSETLITALDAVEAGDYESASEQVQPLIAQGTPGARAAALFLQAGAALEQGETARAVDLYAMIAADEEIPAALRDLARLREVASNFDEREPADAIAKLEPLAQPGSTFYGSAAELTAIAHLEMGNRDEAGAIFAAIAKDDTLPETLTRRAQQLAGVLGVDAIEDVEALLREEGVLPQEGEEAAGAPR